MAHIQPGDHTVKEATKLLTGLTDEELAAAYDSELEGKGRRSLLGAISAARDTIREELEAVSSEKKDVATTGKEVVVGGRRYIVLTTVDGYSISMPKN
tara:strand:- start:3764 stop:4057 length:294 start_codon:yes stop_codon:yes gene_type:complete